MNATEWLAADPEVGSRVRVWGADGEYYGLGTYKGRVPMEEALGEFESFSPAVYGTKSGWLEDSDLERNLQRMLETRQTTGKIVLDLGMAIYGFQCSKIELVTDESANVNAGLSFVQWAFVVAGGAAAAGVGHSIWQAPLPTVLCAIGGASLLAMIVGNVKRRS